MSTTRADLQKEPQSSSSCFHSTCILSSICGHSWTAFSAGAGADTRCVALESLEDKRGIERTVFDAVPTKASREERLVLVMAASELGGDILGGGSSLCRDGYAFIDTMNGR